MVLDEMSAKGEYSFKPGELDYYTFLNLPLFICIILFAVPYLFYQDTNKFKIILYLPWYEHVIACLFLVGLVVTSYFFGWRLSRHVETESPVWTSRTTVLLKIARMLVFGSLFVYLFQFVIVIPVFLARGLLAARASFDIPGIGILLRLPIVALPLLCTLSRGKSKKLIRLIVIYVVFAGIRGIIMSERVDLIAAGITAWVCLDIIGRRPRWRSVVVFGMVAFLFFSGLQRARLYFLSQIDSHVVGQSFLDDTIAYYTDTQNKFYLVADGVLKYPYTFFSQFTRVFSEKRSKYKNEMDEFLTFRNPSLGYTVSSLNNPGGFAQDASDFGVWLFWLPVALKFAFCGFVLALYKKRRIYTSLTPVVMLQVIEYPRYNYFYMTFTIGIVLVLCIVIFGCRLLEDCRSSRAAVEGPALVEADEGGIFG